jgi:hypothetical protein
MEAPMTGTRSFPTLDVVSVTTGVMVSDRGMPALYEVLDYVLDDRLMTHQLPAASRAAEPGIYKQHPWLAGLDAPRGDLPALKAWCAALVEQHGWAVDLAPVGADWCTGNALQDLTDIRQGRPVITID